MTSAEQRPIRSVTVFGGTGFLGRRIVDLLSRRGIRVTIAARRPGANGGPDGEPARVIADVRDAASVTTALQDADAAVNAVGLYAETDGATFQSVHADGARNVARAARAEGGVRLVHISGIGVDPASRSAYVRSRAAGEEAVRQACPDAMILRPSVLFGPGDAFLTTLIGLTRRLPVVPLFGRGQTRLQPVYVGDVAAAVSAALAEPTAPGRTFELGGPDTLPYADLLDLVGDLAGTRRPKLPVPFAVWRGIAALGTVLPFVPVGEAQVTLMESDNVADPALPGLGDLGIAPVSLDEVLRYDFELGD